MKNNDYITWRRNGTSVLKIFILEKENCMTVNSYVKDRLLEKDKENLVKTKLAVASYISSGTPLVPNFERKIRNYCDRYNMHRSQVIASILSNDVAATAFAKQANRQRTAEKAQLEYMQLIRGIRIDGLPSSGYRSLRLQDNEIVDGFTPRNVNSTKTFDAVSDNNHTLDYIFQKFTMGSGGAQDNQGRDAIRFLEAAWDYVETHDNRVRFVAILDGDYYDRHWDVFTSYRSDRVLVETADTYKTRGRKALYVTNSIGKIERVSAA
jgi:hypothetical protein